MVNVTSWILPFLLQLMLSLVSSLLRLCCFLLLMFSLVSSQLRSRYEQHAVCDIWISQDTRMLPKMQTRQPLWNPYTNQIFNGKWDIVVNVLIPANIRVLIDVRFQKAVTVDAATIFFRVHLLQALNAQDFAYSTGHSQRFTTFN